MCPMKYDVQHQISWRYDQPVFVEPMTVRLRPRCDGSLILREWQLTFAPQPAGVCQSLDALGNAVSLVWFDQRHETLAVTASSSLVLSRDNPFDYLLTSHNPHRLPLNYDDSHHDWLLPYRRRVRADDRIDRWANQLALANGETQSFLLSLASAMFTEFERTRREDGPVFSPPATLQSRRGACRDLAVLFIDACRSVGIASRFVSGYVYETGRKGSCDLHAWAEVYLPGAGWRGYDPSLGLAVADRHIPLAAAPEPDDAAPTTGTFRGTCAQSTMKYEVQIRATHEP